MSLEKFANATLEDIAANPKQYGAPTYEEFCKNPEHWRINKQQSLVSADKGSQVFTNVKKHIYYVDGNKCGSLEKVEQYCIDHGIGQQDLTIEVGIEKITAGQVVMHVNFRSKNVPEKS